MRKGFTLVEVIIAIVISSIAIFGIETLIVESFKDWKASKNIVDLERDLDVASYKIKGILEEASVDTIYTTISGSTVSDSGIRVRVGNSSWLKEKEFYRASGTENKLIYKNADGTGTDIIIDTLQSISFVNGSDKHSVKVGLTVVKEEGTLKERKLSSSFLVYLRNKGGG